MTDAQQHGRLTPAPGDPARPDFMEAMRSISRSGSFRVIVNRIEARLAEIDTSNRRRGKENMHTEAEAWEWFLTAVAAATGAESRNAGTSSL